MTTGQRAPAAASAAEFTRFCLIRLSRLSQFMRLSRLSRLSRLTRFIWVSCVSRLTQLNRLRRSEVIAGTRDGYTVPARGFCPRDDPSGIVSGVGGCVRSAQKLDFSGVVSAEWRSSRDVGSCVLERCVPVPSKVIA